MNPTTVMWKHISFGTKSKVHKILPGPVASVPVALPLYTNVAFCSQCYYGISYVQSFVLSYLNTDVVNPWHACTARVTVINPRRACSARVTVLGAVCLSVCLLSHISPMERLFVLKTLSCTQWARKVKTFVGICLKRLRSRVMPRNRSEKANLLIIPTYPHSAFSA